VIALALAALLGTALPPLPPADPAAAPAATIDPAAAMELPTLAADCPATKVSGPRIPVDVMRAGKPRKARVRAGIDACGRVLSVELAESSGHAEFDRAALDAVAGFVVPARTVAGAKDGTIVVPMAFMGTRDVEVEPIDWPASHRRPRYVVDPEPIPLPSIEAFDRSVLRDSILRYPYKSVSLRDGTHVRTTIQRERDDPSTWWLHRVTQPPKSAPGTPPSPVRTDALVRYRLVEEDGEPVVRVAMLCGRPEAECTVLRDFFMQGLPFAKPR
jgi:TonB family protein